MNREAPEGEERFRLLVEQAVDGIFLADAAGHFLEANTAGCRMLGYTREEVLSRRIADVVTLEESGRIGAEVARLAEGRVARSEWRFLRKDGSIFVGEVVGRQLPDGRLQGIVRDITERKQTEAALRESEGKYRSLFNSIDDGFCIIEVLFGEDGKANDYRFLEVNAAFEKHTGLKDPAGKTIREMVPNQDAHWFDTYGRIALTGEPKRFSSQGQALGRFFEVYAVRMGQPHERKVAVLFRDETERKRAEEELKSSEERFRAVLENMSEGVMLFDSRQNLFYQNSASLRIHGFVSKEQEQIPRDNLPTTWDAWDERGRAITFEEWPVSRVFRGERFQGQVLRVVRVETGQEFYGSYNGSPIFDAQGKLMLGFITIRDITKEFRALRAVRESEERFRVAQELSPDGFTIFRPVRDDSGRVVDFTWLYENATIARLNGTDPRAVLGRRLLDVFPGHRNTPFHKAYQEVAETGQSQVVEAPYKGDTIVRQTWFRVAVVSMGQDIAVLSQDITERKRAEDSVQRARERSELLSRTISRLLAIPDPQTVVEELCNEVRKFLQADVFFNYLLPSGASRLKFNACGGVDPRLARKVEALELGQSLCGTAARNACRLHAESLEATNDPRSALVRSLGIRAYACHPLFGADNEVIGTLSFGARDRARFSAEDLELMKAVADHVAIAMLRRRSDEAKIQAEKRLRSVLEATGVGLWLHELPSGRLNWDAKTRALFFVKLEEEVTLELFWSRVHPDDRPRMRLEVEAALRDERLYAMDHRTVDPATGQVRWVHAEGNGSYDEDGKPIRFDGINYDITERKEAEAVLARDKSELERLVAERTAKLQELVGELEHFSYTITHDLKSPLRAMRGFAEVAGQVCGQDEAKPFLEKISTAAERMDNLIRDALNYSRTVRQELPLDDIDTGELLRGILDSYPDFQPFRAKIKIEGSLPVVLGNEAGLTQCFSNLLSNAVKFVKPGQMPEIRIWAEPHFGWSRIWIEDKGIGIAKEMLPRVFDMFSRASKNYEGTGIGLALVRKVVHRMGGRVGVESEEGKGSRFWIELKRGETRPSHEEGLAAIAEPRRGTVLYVEDEEGDVAFMERAFATKGLTSALRVVGDGRAAIQYLSGTGKYGEREEYPLPSVVLLDLNLPVVSGFEVLQWMRNHPDFARTVVVVFSSSTLESDRVRAQELGANEFIAKPSSGLQFGALVDHLRQKWLP